MEPKNPDTIVLRNSYYPSGLTEKMVWDYYHNNKLRILNESKDKDVVLFMFVRENEYIVRRFINYRPIRLDIKSYDKIINGRTVTLSVEPGDRLNYFCIDIDTLDSTPEDKKKEAVKDVLSMYSTIKQIYNNRIISTSTGYHVYGYFKKSVPNDVAINIIRKNLYMKLKDKYGIGQRLYYSNKEISLDFAPMYSRGSHVLPYALNRNGLIAIDVTKKLDSFDRKHAIIK